AGAAKQPVVGVGRQAVSRRVIRSRNRLVVAAPVGRDGAVGRDSANRPHQPIEEAATVRRGQRLGCPVVAQRHERVLGFGELRFGSAGEPQDESRGGMDYGGEAERGCWFHVDLFASLPVDSALQQKRRRLTIKETSGTTATTTA